LKDPAMKTFAVAGGTPPATAKVFIAGSFNGWNATKTALTGPNQSGEYSVDLPLAPGRYSYKFVVDGKWMLDPANSETEDNGLGDKNSVVTVSAEKLAAAPTIYADRSSPDKIFVRAVANGSRISQVSAIFESALGSTTVPAKIDNDTIAITVPPKQRSVDEDIPVQIPMGVEVTRPDPRRVIERRQTGIGQEEEQEGLVRPLGPARVPAAEPFGPLGDQEKESGDQLKDQTPVERISLHAGGDHRVHQPGPVEVRTQPVLPGDVEHGPDRLERPDATAADVAGLLDGHQSRARGVAVPRRAERPLELLGGKNPAVAVERSDHRPREVRRTAGLGIHRMGGAVEDHLVAPRADVQPQSDLCPFYPSDAADDLLCLDLGGRRLINGTLATLSYPPILFPRHPAVDNLR